MNLVDHNDLFLSPTSLLSSSPGVRGCQYSTALLSLNKGSSVIDSGDDGKLSYDVPAAGWESAECTEDDRESV